MVSFGIQKCMIMSMMVLGHSLPRGYKDIPLYFIMPGALSLPSDKGDELDAGFSGTAKRYTDKRV